MREITYHFISRNREEMRNVELLEIALHSMTELANLQADSLQIEFTPSISPLKGVSDQWYANRYTFIIKGNLQPVNILQGYIEAYAGELLKGQREE